MTTQRCRPLQPFRCWQYHAESDDEPVPRWVASRLSIPEKGAWEFDLGENDQHEIKDGWWIVEFESGEHSQPCFGMFTQEEMAQLFHRGAQIAQAEAANIFFKVGRTIAVVLQIANGDPETAQLSLLLPSGKMEACERIDGARAFAIRDGVIER